jgi:hypothetical protein
VPIFLSKTCLVWKIVRTLLLVVRCWCRNIVDDRPVGNPKRRLWWAHQQVFSQLWNQGLSNQ